MVTSGPSVSRTVKVFVTEPVRPTKSRTDSVTRNLAPSFAPRIRKVFAWLVAPFRFHVWRTTGLPSGPRSRRS